MSEASSSLTLRNEPQGDDCYDTEWIEPDDLDLLDSDCVLLDKGELLSYTAGAIVTAALVLQGHLVLDYPLSVLPTSLGSTVKADAVATFSVICLGTFAANLFASASGLRRATMWDGMLSSYFALGIYLFPQVAIHKPLLIAVAAMGIALSIWDHRHECLNTSLVRLAWRMIANTAFISFLVVALGSAGIIPMATSGTVAADNPPDNARVMASLFSRESLDDMSYQEAADALKVVVHVESARLGLREHEPYVLVGYTGSAIANYNARTNAITLNASLLSQPRGLSGYETVECVAHEMAHAYQCAVVDGTIKGRRNSPLGMLTPEDTARWREELDHGVDSNRHFVEYWYQDIEVRARDYADKEMPYLLAMAEDAA